MTSLLHRFETHSTFERRVQQAELEYVAGSLAARTTIGGKLRRPAVRGGLTPPLALRILPTALPAGSSRMLRRVWSSRRRSRLSCARPARDAEAQDYPSRPIRLLIHTPPGSLVDVLGRLVGQELSQRLGQSIVADNRTGGATMIAVEQLIRSPADGYTLMISTSEATMQPFLKKSYRTDPIKDFTPVALVVTSWTVFAVNPKVPANTLPELVAYSKSHPGALRLRRHRRRAAHRGRDAQAQERRQFRPRALSRRRAGGDRRDLGPDRDGVDGACLDARCRRRAVEDPRAGRPEPASDAARRADHGARRASRTCGWTPGSAWPGRRACRRRSSRASTKSLPWS